MTNAIMELLRDNNTNLYTAMEKLGYYKNFATKSLENNHWTEDTLFGLASLFGVEYVQHFIGYEWLNLEDERMTQAIKYIMKEKKITFKSLATEMGCTKQNISYKVNSNNMRNCDIKEVGKILGVEFESYFVDKNTGVFYR